MLKIDFPKHLIPNNVDELIARMDSTDNRVVARKFREEIRKFDEAIDNGRKPEFSEGLIMAVKKAIQERNRSMVIKTRSADEVRKDHILRTRNSDGRATARRFI